MIKILPAILTFLLYAPIVRSQNALPDSCKLSFGINPGGISDYMTEMPFVDVMHQSRSWMTSNTAAWVSGGVNAWETGLQDSILKDSDGYPLNLPYSNPGLNLDTTQCLFTVWANTTAWQPGIWILLYDGEGEFDFWGDATVVGQTPGRMEVQVNPSSSNIIRMKILRSNPLNHVRNIRFLMPGTEFTYQQNPFNSTFLDLIKPFNTIRFMDWGHTNGWGCSNWPDCVDDLTDSIRVPWSQRSAISRYSWSYDKGVPYEMMIKLCNQTGKNMWICVPHLADNEYIRKMAELVRDSLDKNLTVNVEFSNETWNWMFMQTQWLNEFGCVAQNQTWPEGIVPYIQNCMDIWSDVFSNEMYRLNRVVGVQGAWQDVSNRIVFNMTPGSFDAFSPAAYFGISQQTDSIFDNLGAAATAAQLAQRVRIDMSEAKQWLINQKESIADSLNIPMIFYEGGQHITPHPFGTQPSYEQALLDIQRDTSIYALYNEWFSFVRTLQTGENPMLFMHFSFIGPRSARYGSWGILEFPNQDTTIIPAPKYKAIMDNIADCSIQPTSLENTAPYNITVFPNPFRSQIQIKLNDSPIRAELYDIEGRLIRNKSGNIETLSFPDITPGMYILKIFTNDKKVFRVPVISAPD